MRLLHWFVAIASGITAVLPTVAAQGQKAAPGLSESEAAQLYANTKEPGAGVYRVQPLHAAWCVRLRSNFFIQGWCESLGPADSPSFRQIAIIPSPSGGQTVRSMATLNGNDGRLRGCATVARNVVVGPARIDNNDCDVPVAATNWGAAGGTDQRFRFRQVGPHVYEIVTPSNECWDVRDQSRDAGAEIVQWRCNYQGNQRFELSYLTPLPDTEARFLLERGWRHGPDGMRRATPVRSVNLYGSDMTTGPTLDDGGVQCASRCIEDQPCRAYTWVRAGVQAPTPVCWLKNAIPAPSRDGNTASGVIR